jgi:transposase-like protein
MTVRYTGDCCPACGSYQVIPYAVIVGGSEEYGYQCQTCEVMWPVLTHPARGVPDPARQNRSPAA